MRYRNMMLVFAMTLSLVAPAVAQRGQGMGRGGPGRGMNGPNERALCLAALDSIPRKELDSTEAAGLLYLRQEEKLARDIYAKLYAKWGARYFGNISRSEERHMDAVKLLLDRHGLKDPVDGSAPGHFDNAGLKELYQSYLNKGEQSLNDALIVGATIEDLDIRDLEQAAAHTDNPDLKMVYLNLARASENHLQVFVRQLKAAGSDYAPQYISPARYSEAISRTMPQGRGNGRGGNGPGMGRGNGNCPWLNP